MATLTPEERERYDRQIMIDGLGEAGQQKLKRARVFIAGAGGLGSAVSLYLTAAGVGTIRIVDHDKVELSNLNRQVLHRDEDIGQPKVGSAATRLSRLNPDLASKQGSIISTFPKNGWQAHSMIRLKRRWLSVRYALSRTGRAMKNLQ